MQSCDFTINKVSGQNGQAGNINLENCQTSLAEQASNFAIKALPITGVIALGLLATVSLIYIAKRLRIVVGTNDVHIVQSRKATISYGKGQQTGNVYYKWPSWIPIIGVQTTTLPISVFSLSLKDYAAYDKGRVPFIIDIIGFFRIADSNMAAERLANFEDLQRQLTGILQGAIRSILANNEIQDILEGRSKFGDEFTHAVDEQLKNWGVQTVKTIELMDIRDAQDSKVIANIMMKKKSLIEMQSRVEVAMNMQTAQTKEIEAKRQVGLAEQEALETVGKRTAEKDQAVGIATQTAAQAVKEQEKATATKQMAVQEVLNVRQAEITRAMTVTKADQDRQEAIILAEGERQQQINRAEGEKAKITLVAEGNLAQQKLNAEGILVQGQSKAEAERLMLRAPVSTQIELAKEIGQNQGYQHYLISIKQVEANQVVGVEQAKALSAADIKVIANAGNPAGGLASVRELFSSAGGQAVGAALEGLANTPVGAAIVEKLTNGKDAN